jgi:hypothetical protein
VARTPDTRPRGKLSEKTWQEVAHRFIVGNESASALGREYGVSEAAIRKRCGSKKCELKTLSNQIVTISDKYLELEHGSRVIVDDLVTHLKVISSNLGAAAANGAITAAALSRMAIKQIAKVDEDEPLEGIAHLNTVGVLTKLSNESASLGMQLIAANRDVGKGGGQEQIAAALANLAQGLPN